MIATVLFASRDNVIRWLSGDTATPPLVAAAATFLGGTLVMAAYVSVTRRGPRGKPLALAGRAFLPPASCFGLSYVALFEAYYRGRVTIVSPLVATESLWGVSSRRCSSAAASWSASAWSPARRSSSRAAS